MRVRIYFVCLLVAGTYAQQKSYSRSLSLSTDTSTPTSSPTIVNGNDTAAPTALPDSNETQSPTLAPGGNTTAAPTPTGSHRNATAHPTSAPSILPPNVTVAPTAVNHNTSAPTIAPTNSTDTPAPTSTPVGTSPPTAAPITAAPVISSSPTTEPTANPEDASHHVSFFRILTKTIAWLILLGLGLLAFGAIMNHRYRIYFFFRGVWLTLRQLRCSQWILQKLRIGDYGSVDAGLNTIIFDNDMTEGLLLQENNG
jgi:hypothetical protein